MGADQFLMYQPQTYEAALVLMILTMICWGSWANTMKMVPSHPFQLFYWDYVLGVAAVTVVAGLTIGSVNPDASSSFVTDLRATDTQSILYALAGGIVFNIANLLLVAAIAIAGLAVAFPVGIGLALVVGVLLNYTLAPQGNPLLLFGGVALVLSAIIVDAIAFRLRGDAGDHDVRRGLKLALGCGVLMGSFYPLVVKAGQGPAGLGPYALAAIFAVGVLLCAVPVNTLLMRKPLTADRPVTFHEYGDAPFAAHAWGLIGGVIWGTGMVASLVAANANLVGPAISYAIGQGATMISAAWGIFVWREFASAPTSAKRLLAPMFLLFAIGLSMVAVAPLDWG
jgi:glucose uptake protein